MLNLTFSKLTTFLDEFYVILLRLLLYQLVVFFHVACQFCMSVMHLLHVLLNSCDMLFCKF